jgi:hypothetical protein
MSEPLIRTQYLDLNGLPDDPTWPMKRPGRVGDPDAPAVPRRPG